MSCPGVIADGEGSPGGTVAALDDAHVRAAGGGATVIHNVAVPFVGYESTRATDVKPDFVVVAAKVAPDDGSWLIVGDAKDYERLGPSWWSGCCETLFERGATT